MVLNNTNNFYYVGLKFFLNNPSLQAEETAFVQQKLLAVGEGLGHASEELYLNNEIEAV